MDKLRKQFESIVNDIISAYDYRRERDRKYFVDDLLQVVENYFKQTGKRGGETTKKKADYVALGKKGAAKRWKKAKEKLET